MKTTKNQFETYLIDVKGYGADEVEEASNEWGNDLEAFLRGHGANDDTIKEMNGYIK